MLIKSVTELIGQTPLLEIDPKVHGLKHISLYAKLEHLNPFGSLKDRPAWNILGEQLDDIHNASQTVIESSSGNMAKAMQVICSMRGIPFRVVSNRFPVQEVKQVLQVLGAHISEIPSMSSCPDPTDPNNPIAHIEREMNAQPGKYFHTSQFTNEKNMEAHRSTTGPEIIKDLGSPVNYFITGMGTTGSSRGAGEFLKTVDPRMTLVGVVAPPGQFIPGIRSADEMYEVGLFKKDVYSRIVEVNINESIDGMLVLARKLGVLAGPTSGASYIAALKYLRPIDKKLKQKRNAVFIVCDRLEWYLSYLQKYRPDLFGFTRKDTPRNMSEKACAAAPQVTIEQANVLLSANSHCLIVDLRGSLAFKAGHIEGAINIPGDVLEEICEMGIPFSKKHHVLFVCPQGEDSLRFTAFLAQRDITCTSLKGGFIAWRDAGMPIYRPTANK